ncbi:MAG: putative sugar nucleotidyl transferase [Thermofilaceae archaeon]
MRIAVFEDGAVSNLSPLTLTRAVFDLRVGRYTLLERVQMKFGTADLALVRGYLAEYYREVRKLEVEVGDADDDVLLVNPRFVLDPRAMGALEKLCSEGRRFILLSGADVVGALLPRHVGLERLHVPVDSSELVRSVKGRVEPLYIEGSPIDYPWQLVELNSRILPDDAACGGGVLGEVDETVKVLGRGGLAVGEGAVVEPYVVLDTRKGPILIESGAEVKAHAYVEGPCVIGRGTVVMPGARVREGCSIGPVCRVGGEVEESIIHGFSNKYHDGFLGHAYVGEWVNLGALTTNSDLKNTYGTVRVGVGARRLDTGRVKVGAFIADFVKTAIGTLIYTGKRVGVSSHLHGVVVEDVPSFTIYAKSLGQEPVELRLESAVETARRMMARRGVSMPKALEALLERVFELTRSERAAAGVRAATFQLVRQPE